VAIPVGKITHKKAMIQVGKGGFGRRPRKGNGFCGERDDGRLKRALTMKKSLKPPKGMPRLGWLYRNRK